MADTSRAATREQNQSLHRRQPARSSSAHAATWLRFQHRRSGTAATTRLCLPRVAWCADLDSRRVTPKRSCGNGPADDPVGPASGSRARCGAPSSTARGRLETSDERRDRLWAEIDPTPCTVYGRDSCEDDHSPDAQQESPRDDTSAAVPHKRTDSGNAELFAARHAHDVHFDHAAQIWRVWGGHSWASDRDGCVRRMAKDAMRARLETAATLTQDSDRQLEVKWALQSESKRALDALLSIAQAEKPLAVTTSSGPISRGRCRFRPRAGPIR